MKKLLKKNKAKPALRKKLEKKREVRKKQKNKSVKKLSLKEIEKIINYIAENCSIFIRTYIIGVFKDHIDEDKNYRKVVKELNKINIKVNRVGLIYENCIFNKNFLYFK